MPHLVRDDGVVKPAFHVGEHPVVARVAVGRRLAFDCRELPREDIGEPRHARGLGGFVEDARAAFGEGVFAELTQSGAHEWTIESERGGKLDRGGVEGSTSRGASEREHRRVQERRFDRRPPGEVHGRLDLGEARGGHVVSHFHVEHARLRRRKNACELSGQVLLVHPAEELGGRFRCGGETRVEGRFRERRRRPRGAELGRGRPIANVFAVRDLLGRKLAIGVANEVDDGLGREIGDVRPNVHRARDFFAGHRIVAVGEDPPGTRYLRALDVLDDVIANVARARREARGPAGRVIVARDRISAEHDDRRLGDELADGERRRVVFVATRSGELSRPSRA